MEGTYTFKHPNGRVVELLDFRRTPDMTFLADNRKVTTRRLRTSHRDRLRQRLYERDGNRCHYCDCNMGAPVGNAQPHTNVVTLEHVVPHGKGGPNTLDNLVLACYTCNNERGDTPNKCHCEFCVNAVTKYGR